MMRYHDCEAENIVRDTKKHTSFKKQPKKTHLLKIKPLKISEV
ncbi:hypothetical protein J3D55_001408 [Chryseobacterium ginsenosidimutans]|nr:hypothetical protein [Chryseobacterium ginsenosidimutans]